MHGARCATDIDFRALMGSFDTVLLGRKTYEATRHHGGGGGMPGMQAYVFSRTLSQADCPGVVVSDNPKATLAALKSKPGKDIWLFGGGSLFGSLLEQRLVDAVEVAVIPCSWAAVCRCCRTRPRAPSSSWSGTTSTRRPARYRWNTCPLGDGGRMQR
jgi:dihydrofolate reductase